MLAGSPEPEAHEVLDNNPDRIGIWKFWFLRRGENRSTQRKTSQSRVENQQQTQPTYDAGSRNQTRDTLVGGERSHHCAIPAPRQGLLMFSAGLGNWLLEAGKSFWAGFLHKKSFPLDGQARHTINLTAGQFAQCLALNIHHHGLVSFD